MKRIRLSLLRGVCQLPAYVAMERGFFAAEGIEAEPQVAPSAWTVPDRLHSGDVDFAVIPWTRVAADGPRDGNRLVLIAGSGGEGGAPGGGPTKGGSRASPPWRCCGSSAGRTSAWCASRRETAPS